MKFTDRYGRRTVLAGLAAVLLGVAGTLALSQSASTSEKASPAAAGSGTATAIFAGGCFWCVESDFDKVEGVLNAVSGYTGGTTENPTYKEVTYSNTGHYEAVKITYDPAIISFGSLVDIFWRTVDPTDPGGQFCDRGDSYRTAVFVSGPDERAAAEASKAEAQAELGKEIVTPILEAAAFYDAEDYHQDYHTKNPMRYGIYRLSCGRDNRVRGLWGDAAYEGIPEKRAW